VWTSATPLAKPTRSHCSAFTIPDLFVVVVGGSTGKGLQERSIPDAEEYIANSSLVFV